MGLLAEPPLRDVSNEEAVERVEPCGSEAWLVKLNSAFGVNPYIGATRGLKTVRYCEAVLEK